MYNEEVKNMYLEQLPTTSLKKLMRSTFKNSLDYEEYFRKDFYNFIEPEIKEFFVAIQSTSFESLNTKCSLLRSYTQWAIDHNMSNDNINHYDSISRDDLRSCLNEALYSMKFITLDELKGFCDDFINPSDKALCYCLFFGIYGESGEELKEVTASRVDTANGCIDLPNGKHVNMPTWVARIIQESCETYENYSVMANGELYRVLLREDDPCVIKSRVNATVDNNLNYKRKISRRIGLLNKEIHCVAFTIKRLKNSGMLWHIKQYMKQTGMTASEVYNDPYTKEIFKLYNVVLRPSLSIFMQQWGNILDGSFGE